MTHMERRFDERKSADCLGRDRFYDRGTNISQDCGVGTAIECWETSAWTGTNPCKVALKVSQVIDSKRS
jgi:hypothetical protein